MSDTHREKKIWNLFVTRENGFYTVEAKISTHKKPQPTLDAAMNVLKEIVKDNYG